jgi:DNA-binding response OmpR family regulator
MWHEAPLFPILEMIMKKTVLVIEESDLVRSYLTSKLGEYGFEVLEAKSGFEGLTKMKNSQPDLVVMEYILPRINGPEVLEEKLKTKSVADIPVIMFTPKVDKEKILSVAKYKVARFFSKPLRIDVLLKAVSEILGVEISLDTTPCNLDVHLNEQILFIETAKGLNREKLELLGYKITEILGIYGVKEPRILLIMTDIELTADDEGKLGVFFRTVLDSTGAPGKAVKLLTTSSFIKEFITKHPRFATIGTPASLPEAMDQLLGIKVTDFVEEGYRIVRDDILAAKGAALAESIQMNFAADKGFSIAVVDDDLVSRELVSTAFRKAGWAVAQYENGKEFTDALASRPFDLVFLDLRMPVMDGFGVLTYMKKAQSAVPVIIFSSLSEKETVVRAMGFGIKSYLAKPLTPDDIYRKAAEILKTNF